jgi:hypothetical protein
MDLIRKSNAIKMIKFGLNWTKVQNLVKTGLEPWPNKQFKQAQNFLWKEPE